MINPGLLAHPLNWITLFLWLAFIGVVIHAFHPHLPE